MAEIEKVNLLDLDEEDYDTVLAPDIQFSGKIECKKPFMIKGNVEGFLVSTSDVKSCQLDDITIFRTINNYVKNARLQNAMHALFAKRNLYACWVSRGGF